MNVKIAALGDSLTYGWMAERGFTDFLEEMLKAKYPKAEISLLNRGVPGDTSNGGLSRVYAQVIEEQPNLTMIQFGLNDALAGILPDNFFAVMKQIADAVRQNTESEILLMTSPLPCSSYMIEAAMPYYEKIAELALKENMPVARVDEYWKKRIEEGLSHRALVQSDLAHPTEEGHRLMAEAIMETLCG